MVEETVVESLPVVENVLSKYQLIEISRIKPGRYQARKYFDDQTLKSLAESIKQEGLQNPITLRQVGESYEVIAGERRLEAVKLLGLKTIEAKIIQTVSEGEAAAKGLIENLQRVDLNPIEEAEGIQALLDLHDGHWSQEQIAKVTGKQQGRISESLQLLKLPTEIQENIRRRIITSGHAVELFRINNANSQKGMANKIVKGGWSVKRTRQMIDRKLGKMVVSNAPSAAMEDPLADQWSRIQADQPIGCAAYWKVQYGPEQTWTFVAKPMGGDYAGSLSTWFSQMAEWLRPPQPPQ